MTTEHGTYRILIGDVLDRLRELPDESVNCCVTSPPYWGLRQYIADGAKEKQYEIGLESTPEAYIAKMVAVFREVRRVLRADGTCWGNWGDSYVSTSRGGDSSTYKTTDDKRASMSRAIFGAEVRRVDIPLGLKPKDLCGIPWRVALALQADGWWLRQDIIWAKPNPMPESVTDRCTKAHEYIFLLTKSARYWYDAEAIKEESSGVSGGACFGKQSDLASDAMAQSRSYERPEYQFRNARSVWTINTHGYSEAHFATFPEALPERCIKAGCPVGGTVLDPFSGSGTSGAVACRLGRNYIGIELNPEYAAMSERRISEAIKPNTYRDMREPKDAGLFASV